MNKYLKLKQNGRLFLFSFESNCSSPFHSCLWSTVSSKAQENILILRRDSDLFWTPRQILEIWAFSPSKRTKTEQTHQVKLKFNFEKFIDFVV